MPNLEDGDYQIKLVIVRFQLGWCWQVDEPVFWTFSITSIAYFLCFGLENAFCQFATCTACQGYKQGEATTPTQLRRWRRWDFFYLPILSGFWLFFIAFKAIRVINWERLCHRPSTKDSTKTKFVCQTDLNDLKWQTTMFDHDAKHYNTSI